MSNNKRFFMNGDEWGLTSILPAENLAHCQRVIDERDSHHKNTDFSLGGWSTAPYIIPDSQIPISQRGINLSDLESIFSDVMPRAVGVDSCEDFTGESFSCPNCFAFALSLEEYWHCEGLYGREECSTIQSLHAVGLAVSHSQRDSVVEAFFEFGQRYDLILFAYANEIVDLRVAGQIQSYIQTKEASDEA